MRNSAATISLYGVAGLAAAAAVYFSANSLMLNMGAAAHDRNCTAHDHAAASGTPSRRD